MTKIGRPRKKNPCPCQGTEGWSWHRRRRRAQCQASIDNGKYNKSSGWQPGTSIYVPDFEEP